MKDPTIRLSTLATVTPFCKAWKSTRAEFSKVTRKFNQRIRLNNTGTGAKQDICSQAPGPRLRAKNRWSSDKAKLTTVSGKSHLSFKFPKRPGNTPSLI